MREQKLLFRGRFYHSAPMKARLCPCSQMSNSHGHAFQDQAEGVFKMCTIESFQESRGKMAASLVHAYLSYSVTQRSS